LPKNGTRTKKDIDEQMSLERNWWLNESSNNYYCYFIYS
jgi:hypothetical protein